MRTPEDSGMVGTFVYDDIELNDLYIDSASGWIRIVGAVLGTATSHKETHLDHPKGTPPPPGRSCSGCRWTEATVVFSATHDQYLVHIVGRTAIEGETGHFKLVWSDTAAGVLKALMVPPPRGSNRPREELELPRANAEALRRAGEFDDALHEVWDAWTSVTRGGRVPLTPHR